MSKTSGVMKLSKLSYASLRSKFVGLYLRSLRANRQVVAATNVTPYSQQVYRVLTNSKRVPILADPLDMECPYTYVSTTYAYIITLKIKDDMS